MKNKEKLLQNNNDTLIYKNNNNIRFKRMNRRLKGGWLVFALSTLSMVSVGFSTWVVTGPASGYGQVDVIADDVIGEKIFNNLNVKTFSLSTDGIVSDGEIVDKGEIIITFSLKYEILNDFGYLDSSNLFSMTSNLYSDNAEFLKLISAPTINVSNASAQKQTTSSNNLTYLISFSLNNSSSETSIEIKYEVTGDLKSYYNNIPQIRYTAEAIRL